MANGKVDIGFKADISDLKNKLSGISGITDKEAKQMVTSLERAFRKASKSAEKAAKQSKTSWVELYSKIGVLKEAYNKLIDPSTNFFSVQADIIDQIGDLSGKTQISATNIEALNYAFGQTGMTTEQVDALLTSFTQTLSKAFLFGGKAARGFKALGVSVKDNKGHIKDSNDLFEESIGKIGQLKTANEQAAAATALFGTEGQNLVMALNGDVKTFDAYVNYAKQFGIEAGPEAINAAGQWESASYGLKVALQTVSTTLVSEFGPILTSVLDDMVTGFIFSFTTVKEMAAKSVDHLIDLFTKFGDLWTKLWNGTLTQDDIAAFKDDWFGSLITLWTTDLLASADAADKAAKAYEHLRDVQKGLGPPKKSDNPTNLIPAAKAENPFAKQDKEIIDGLNEMQKAYDDLANISSKSLESMLTPEEMISKNLDEQLDKIQSIENQYSESAGIIVDAENAKSLAIQAATNDWLEQQKKSISESKSSLKDSFDSILSTMDQVNDKAHEIFNHEVVDPIMKPLNAVQGGLSGIAGAIGGDFWGPLAGGLVDAFMNSEQTIDNLKQQILSIPEILKNVPELAGDLVNSILTDFVPSLVKSLPDIVSEILKLVPDIIYELIDMIPLLIDALIEAIPEIIYAIIDAIPDIIIALLELIPKVVEELVMGILDLFIQIVPEMAKAFWEGLKDFFIPDELFKGHKKEKSSPALDLVKEIVSLGYAQTATYNDTPGPVQVGPDGAHARFSAGDYVIAAREPKNLLKQALDANNDMTQKNQVSSGYIQWADGVFAYNSFTKRIARKRSHNMRQLYGMVA